MLFYFSVVWGDAIGQDQRFGGFGVHDHLDGVCVSFFNRKHRNVPWLERHSHHFWDRFWGWPSWFAKLCPQANDGGDAIWLGGVKYKNIDRNRFGYPKKSNTLVIFCYIQVSDLGKTISILTRILVLAWTHQVRKVQHSILKVFAGAMWWKSSTCLHPVPRFTLVNW